MHQEHEILDRIAASGQMLSDLFMEVLADTQFQDVTRQQIEQIIQLLEYLDQHTATLIERPGNTDVMPEFESLTQQAATFHGADLLDCQFQFLQQFHGLVVRPLASKVELF